MWGGCCPGRGRGDADPRTAGGFGAVEVPAAVDVLREASAATKSLDPHYAKAFDIIGSPAAQVAFDLNKESKATCEKYGEHTFGQQCLLARRLVEAGVRLVQINWPRSNVGGRGNAGYDTHANAFKLIETDLYLATDKAFAALADRGLLYETPVILFSEFGRTPKINAAGGQDYWPFCYSLLGGGGVAGGRVVGASDKSGAYPASDPYKPEHLLATIYHCLGVGDGPHDQKGRPRAERAEYPPDHRLRPRRPGGVTRRAPHRCPRLPCVAGRAAAEDGGRAGRRRFPSTIGRSECRGCPTARADGDRDCLRPGRPQPGESASFVRQMIPARGVAGCNAGDCDGTPGGKNVFKLSLRGFDPAADQEQLVHDAAGRRVSVEDPDQSLILLKGVG